MWVKSDVLAPLSDALLRQSELLWAAALALLALEMYIISRLLEPQSFGLGGKCSVAFLLLSISAHVLSALFGYFTHGAVVEMMVLGGEGKGSDAKGNYSLAGHLAATQFGLLVLGIILLVVVVCMNFAAISQRLRRTGG